MTEHNKTVQSFLKDLKKKRKDKQNKNNKKRSRRVDDDDDDANDGEKGVAVVVEEEKRRHIKAIKLKKKVKRKRSDSNSNGGGDGDDDEAAVVTVPPGEESTLTSPSTLHKKTKSTKIKLPAAPETAAVPQQQHQQQSQTTRRVLPPHRYILAPMVGASELPFRLLCRKYGAELAYTPMMDSRRFATDAAYRAQYFHLEDENNNNNSNNNTKIVAACDRPVVAHVSANTVDQFAAAAVQAEAIGCDTIDLNLGCPQRTAYTGHFGSYLLDEPDLICAMVAAAVAATQSIAVCAKIRLLGSDEQETVQFCSDLCAAGVSLIAVHARHRASWERVGPGARDGPALLDQVAAVVRGVTVAGKKNCSNNVAAIVTNGNTTTWDGDVTANLQSTGAAGIMSAEGLLDNPALFLPRHGRDRDTPVTVWSLRRKNQQQQNQRDSTGTAAADADAKMLAKKKRKMEKRLREIEAIEEKVNAAAAAGDPLVELTAEEAKVVASKQRRLNKLKKLQDPMEKVTVTLGSLYDVANDKLKLAMEYVDLATAFPVAIRSVVFHVRRMLKDMLVRYQLLEECLNSETIDQVRAILVKMEKYRANPATFVYDSARAKQEKDALERKKLEEGKRKAYEARMMRKAKREGKADLHYYLNIGAELPAPDKIQEFRAMPREAVMAVWKEHHSQHCLAYHLDSETGCQRGRACAFLHVAIAATGSNNNAFSEKDECAG